jgi:heteromeric Ino2p/Ino4p transcription factor
MSTSPAREGSANAGSSNGNSDEKPRLSEHEKKANHIASGKLPILLCSLSFLTVLPLHLVGRANHPPIEQKRRQAIREGFDRLTELVPGLEGQGRSESVVLKKTVDYIKGQLEERRRLIQRIEELGGQVEEGMRRT